MSHEVLPPPSTSTRLPCSSEVSYSMRAGMICPLNRSMSCTMTDDIRCYVLHRTADNWIVSESAFRMVHSKRCVPNSITSSPCMMPAGRGS